MIQPRFDRLLTLYCFSPLRKLGPQKYPAMPILMYHSISDCAENKVHPYYWINTTPKVFMDHMRFLFMHGYRTVSLQEITDNVPDGKSVIITFDDGYANFYSEAFPILKNYGFTATVFLPTRYIGTESFNGRKSLTWQQVIELRKEGISFGSHTHTHPHLRSLSRAAICDELITSRKMLEDKLGMPVTLFSYPYRFPEELRTFVAFLRQALQDAGYTQGVTTRIGRHSHTDLPFFMKRLPINNCDDLAFFRAKLEGHYDWLHAVQVVTKGLKGLLS